MESKQSALQQRAATLNRIRIQAMADLIRAGVVKTRIAPREPAAGSKPACGPSTACGRNEPCPCKSGKKLKKCHGAK